MEKEYTLSEGAFLVSETDEKGIITFANDDFCEMAEYTIDELIGKPHNIVRHPDMPKVIFKDLWTKLKAEGHWSGFVKNLRKDEGFYWVYAEISQVIKNGELVEYKSVRTPMSFEDKIKYQLYYDELREKNKELLRRVIYQ